MQRVNNEDQGKTLASSSPGFKFSLFSVYFLGHQLLDQNPDKHPEAVCKAPLVEKVLRSALEQTESIIILEKYLFPSALDVRLQPGQYLFL